ncbi:MAG: dihydroorotate dehydrogenase-like protein [Spirochaetes bacterium]|jgi:dihydroorotate dehydrogenase (fumarate)|nr:dihydroorotate dehydrogenase-like protein [Spirochaetota bacterium]
MADLTTSYLGLELKNPVVVSSSGITRNVEGVLRCADAGAGAIVLKSLFEEQIESEAEQEQEATEVSMHPEADDYIRQMGKHLGPDDYLALVEQAKKKTDVPIIASLNSRTTKWWGNYARQLEQAGADAIELNMSIMPRRFEENADQVERRYVNIVDKVRRQTSVPLAAKIGPFFTALPHFTTALRKAGVQALVLFNRFYQLDINIQTKKLAPGYMFSTPQEVYLPLRWISILHPEVGCDLSASTGVHTGTEAVKLLLAGAKTVQVCSTLYKNGIDRIATIRSDIERWMTEGGYETIDDFRGMLNQSQSGSPEAYERLQYIKALTGVS